jgi:anti-sigma factor RsiW
MSKPNDLDELLVAYADGELDPARRAEVEAMCERAPALRDQVAALRDSAELVRKAFYEVEREDIPERLIAAARGEKKQAAEVVRFPERRGSARPQARWWVGMAAAASLFGVLVGAGGTYYALPKVAPAAAPQTRPPESTNVAANWIDNIAGYHRMFSAAATAEQQQQRAPFVDFRSEGDSGKAVLEQISQRIAEQGLRVPNLKPWGMKFEGARMLFVEGRPAAQLFYTTDNKALGPLTVVVGTSKRQDASPSFDKRGEVNVLSWRTRGKMYAIVGQTDIGYIWNLYKDIAWQFDAI